MDSNEVEKRWNEAVNESANSYVERRGYSGSYDALARKMVFAAAANTAENLDADEVLAAIVAGRELGKALKASMEEF